MLTEAIPRTPAGNPVRQRKARSFRDECMTRAARTVHSPGRDFFSNFLAVGINHSLWTCRTSYSIPAGSRSGKVLTVRTAALIPLVPE